MSSAANFLPTSASVKPPILPSRHTVHDLSIDHFDSEMSADHSDSHAPYLHLQARQAHQRMLEAMQVIRDLVKPTAKVVRAGDVLYRAGQPFDTVFLINAGAFKLVSRSLDGREQIVSLKFRGDWLGFSGIANGRHACDAVAMDTGNVSIIPYDALAEGCSRHTPLMSVVHSAMSTEISRERESLMSVCTLASQARVAEFLCAWARSMAQRGLRADELTLRMTRADLGNYLGMTLETVSRCLSRLAREQLIRFGERGRRQITIPDLARLENYVISGTAGKSTHLQ
ncbi:Crp/Fnr family transcriptional regulator [Roseateles amylovorans]|uniref:Helix-turn-helix domain-containing protein n=1 Tax=Roseateles amylovorans TaxID=2978473 RepID=A0ABY6ASN5_9BURK|nr:helix-turn-helix domain-containing protein [Roseateles amylovorans]UXH76244.1 helix-turn-helix domain-containing protein [Roseateles amylovorans]